MPAATGMPKPTERTSAPSRLRTIRGATSPRSPVALDWRVAPPLLGAEHPLNCTNVPPLLSHPLSLRYLSRFIGGKRNSLTVFLTV